MTDKNRQFDASQVKESQDFYDIETHEGYLMDKYRGRVIRDEMYERDITVEYVFDLKFEDLDLEDQKLAMKVGWAFGVGNKTSFDKCTHFKGYLFTPRQWRLWHAPEKYPALISAEGTGKSLIFWLFLIRVCMQFPGTRTLFMRETYQQLTSASLPTLWKIFDHFGWEEDKHFVHHVSNKKVLLKVGNKESEMLYMAAQNESGDVMEIVRNIRSLEVDCIVADEIANIHELVFNALRSRVGRWGKVKDASLRKLIAGGNPPPEGSWQHKRWYDKKDSKGEPLKDAKAHTVFGGSTYENRRNVAPEIIEALETSDDYWRNTFLYGYPGFMPPNGEPVYRSFKYETYVSMEPLDYNPALPLLRGWDIGPTAVNKACVAAQLDSRGILIVLAEFTMNDPGVMKFGEHVSEQCNILFPGVPYVRDFTDPVAFDISQTDSTSPATRLYELGIILYPGEEKFQARHDAVISVMNRLVDGDPGMRIDGTRCRQLVDGFLGGYRYKTVDATHERYSREPLKDIYSHCFPGNTFISTPSGLRRIDEITSGDCVVTPEGERIVTATMNQDYEGDIVSIRLSNGREIQCTANHPIYTRRGIVRADDLRYNDRLWEDEEYTNRKTLTESGITKSRRDITNPTFTSMAEPIYTETYGNIIMDQYLRVRTFTTSMVTRTITILQTLDAFRLLNTLAIISKNDMLTIQSPTCEVSLLRKTQPETGIVPRRDWLGTRNTQRKHGEIEKRKSSIAQSVARNIKHIFNVPEKVSVLHTVNSRQENFQAKTTSQGSARYAKENSESIDTQYKKPVVRVVGLKVKKERLRVYDLTVANEHCFYANSVLVGNCHDAFQYLCSRLFHMDNRKRDNSPGAQRRRDRALLNKRKRHMGGYTQAKLDRLRG